MDTNGEFKKYFDALNKRLDVNFEAIDKRFEAIDKRFEAIDKRFEAIEKPLDFLQEKGEAQGQSILSLHDSLATVIRIVSLHSTLLKNIEKRVSRLEKRVERLEIGQNELIKMVADIRGIESGQKLELKGVQYNAANQTLTGVIREKARRYATKRKPSK
ncbi:MAG: hypothetical protein HY961_18080 [Ignavibacteriae bacterium]|nr:hypothetical protein [Ignavibacteriota bacterium]